MFIEHGESNISVELGRLGRIQTQWRLENSKGKNTEAMEFRKYVGNISKTSTKK